MKIRWVILAGASLLFALPSAQCQARRLIYLGGAGGIATLSGDGNAVVTSSSASTSLFDPMNGAAADVFVGIHRFEYVSFQGDYVWNRNNVALISTSGGSGATSFFKQPETFTQNALLANVLVYFRPRRSRVRPYLSEGGGVAFIESRIAGQGVSQGDLPLPPASTSHVSPALRTLVGMDVRLRGDWTFRYSFSETLTQNTFGNQLSPAEHRIAKNFQNLFGVYFQF